MIADGVSQFLNLSAQLIFDVVVIASIDDLFQGLAVGSPAALECPQGNAHEIPRSGADKERSKGLYQVPQALEAGYRFRSDVVKDLEELDYQKCP
jgi:hypothetical protein